MMKKIDTPVTELKKKIITEIRILQEMKSFRNSMKTAGGDDGKKILSQLDTLGLYLKKTSDKIAEMLGETVVNSPLPKIQQMTIQSKQPVQQTSSPLEYVSESAGYSLKDVWGDEDEDMGLDEEQSDLEKETLKRVKKKEKKGTEKKEKKPSTYVKKASKMFADYSRSLVKKSYFKALGKDLIKANMEFVAASYMALILYTTMWAAIIGFIVTVFFLFFNLSPVLPIITMSTEEIGTRLVKVIWIFLLAPIITFISMYVYPSLEKRSQEIAINQEIPFSTIHMAAISGSMIDPTKIFKIIIETEEYPAIGKEFTKLLNQINVYGYDVVGALRNMAYNNASRKLADLYNSLATAITSGGDLPDFFDKRASTLLFEHKLEREKQAKAAETFMDIYISVVIAAPMILMLLLMMLKIGGLGVGLSTTAITLVMVLGVVMINIFFLTFLHLRQSGD